MKLVNRATLAIWLTMGGFTLPVSTALAQTDTPTSGTPQPLIDPANKAFMLGDYATASQLWEKAAAAGDPEAMNNLGILYYKGLGFKQDVKQAEAWYLRAAHLGYTNAQFNLGNLYFNGDGIDQNLTEAARWYTAAARANHLRAQYYLAQMYEHGDGVKEDHATALNWYVKSADGGLPEAKYVVGRMLLTGDGLQKDQPKALGYLLDAASAGVPHARALLGQAYADGLGTEPNLVEAYVWLSLALDNLPPGQLQQKAFTTLRRVEQDMTQDQMASGKRLLARMEVHQTQNQQ
jgi:TPR repeat protein